MTHTLRFGFASTACCSQPARRKPPAVAGELQSPSDPEIHVLKLECVIAVRSNGGMRSNHLDATSREITLITLLHEHSLVKCRKGIIKCYLALVTLIDQDLLSASTTSRTVCYQNCGLQDLGPLRDLLVVSAKENVENVLNTLKEWGAAVAIMAYPQTTF